MGAKLKVPAKPEHYVRRGRLHRLLDQVVRAPISLVLAPAGAGKTSLLSGWAAEHDGPTCWLTLDESDRDLVRFWTEVISALETVAPGCGDQTHRMLRHPDALLAAVDHLLAGLEAHASASAILVIDDFHLVDEEHSVVRSLAHFVQGVPPQLHVVVASRRVPKLPLDRLRARGHVGEVHFAELRLAPNEAAEMLTRLTPSMPGEQVRAAVARAEGWAAGLQLSALAARSAGALEQPEPPTVGADVLVHDFVWHEVLAHEDRDLVRAMSDVSVVEYVNPGLALALTLRPDATDLLLRAEERGLFVTRLGPDGWFEIHSLVRSALLSELARTEPARIAEQHARAAQWFESVNEVALALDHWLLAENPKRAMHLLSTKHDELLRAGMDATIRRTVAAIPADDAMGDLETTIEFAWCHRVVDGKRFIELADAASWLVEAEHPDQVVRGRVALLQAEAAIMSGRWIAGGELAEHALEEFGDAWWRDPLGRFAWNALARRVALTESWDDGNPLIRRAERALNRDPLRRLALEGTRALAMALAGQPVDALRVAAGVRGAIAVENMPVLQAELAAAEAVAHREIGDGSRGLRELETMVEASSAASFYCQLLALTELVQAGIDDGDLVRAERTLTHALALVEGGQDGSDGYQWLARVATRLALASGDTDVARSWSEQVRDPFWGPVSMARVYLALGCHAEAAGMLEDIEARCVRHDVILNLLQAHVTDDRNQAMKRVATAVEAASANGLLQTVVSEGPESLLLVEHSAWRAPREWVERVRRAGVGRAHHEPTACEPLTKRERDVLRFLPSRLTLGEIADELYISVNTLKFHLKVIYRKLGVKSRAEAAEIARRPATGRVPNGEV